MAGACWRWGGIRRRRGAKEALPSHQLREGPRIHQSPLEHSSYLLHSESVLMVQGFKLESVLARLSFWIRFLEGLTCIKERRSSFCGLSDPNDGDDDNNTAISHILGGGYQTPYSACAHITLLSTALLQLRKLKEVEVKSLSRVRLFATPWSPTRPLRPWDSPGKNTRVGCLFLFQDIFLTEGLNPGLPHCRQTLYHLSHQGSQGNWGIG